MGRTIASSLRSRISQARRQGRRDRRHSIAWLEALEPRIVLNNKFAAISAVVQSVIEHAGGDGHAAAKSTDERSLALLNTVKRVHDDLGHNHNEVSKPQERHHTEATVPLDKHSRSHKLDKRHATETPRDTARQHREARLRAAEKKHAANIQKRRARHRHHQPASDSPPQPASSITFQPLIGGGPPVANNDSYTVFHDQALIATTSASGVLANDTDPNGYALTAVEETSTQHGTLTLNSNGTFVYMPSPGYYGTDSFTYEDYDGYNYSSPATVTITVQETAPTAHNESLTIAHDHTLAGAISATDPENDSLTAAVVAGPQHGTLTLAADGNFTYTPATHYYGSDSFTYEVSDGFLTSNVATVSLTVTETAPVANDDYYTIGVGQVLNSATTATGGVQAFDTDAEGDAFTSQVVTLPQHGTLSFAQDGSFVYTPNAGYSGLDSFTYDDSDEFLTGNAATVYIYVGNQTNIQSYGAFDDPATSAGTAIVNDQLLNWYWNSGSSTDYTAEVQWGDGTESTGTVYYHNRNVGYMINGSHTYAAPGTYAITIAILGDSTAENDMAIFAGLVTATITGQALTATPLTFDTHTDQPAPVEVATFTGSEPGATAGDYAATINWGDGAASNATIVADPSGGGKFDVYGESAYAAAGTFPVSVQVTDDGGSTATASSTAIVTANPLTASGLAASATAGTAFDSTVATFLDTTAGTSASILKAAINWGDGTTSIGSVVANPDVAGQYDVVGDHTYATEGEYTVSVSVADQFGSQTAAAAAMTVAEPPPVATALAIDVTEDQAFDGTVAHFTDADPNTTTADFWATIDWGDGQFSQATITTDPDGGFDVTGTNTYTGPGPYTTTIAVHDQAGAVTTVTGSATVAVPPPLVTIVATQPNANVSGVDGTFTVTRTGDTTKALTVNYIVSGTAKANTDYNSLPGSVTIPIGASSAQIVVAPINDLDPLVANPLTVILTLSPSTNYTENAQSLTATDTVTDITGTQTGIIVTPSTTSSPSTAISLRVTGIPTQVVAGTPYTITISAVNQNGTVVTGYRGTVQLHSSDALAALPASYTFTASDNGCDPKKG